MSKCEKAEVRHPEHSEGSRSEESHQSIKHEILRCAQDDKLFFFIRFYTLQTDSKSQPPFQDETKFIFQPPAESYFQRKILFAAPEELLTRAQNLKNSS